MSQGQAIDFVWVWVIKNRSFWVVLIVFVISRIMSNMKQTAILETYRQKKAKDVKSQTDLLNGKLMAL